MCTSKNVASYIKEKGINISAMSRATGIKRGKLHASLSEKVSEEKRRPLRDEELLKVCDFLEVNPMDFAEKLMKKPQARKEHELQRRRV